MGNPFFLAGLAIIATALLALLFFGNSGQVAGLESDKFAQLAQLVAVGLLVGVGVLGRGRLGGFRLWHVAAWLAVLVALMFGYSLYHGG